MTGIYVAPFVRGMGRRGREAEPTILMDEDGPGDDEEDLTTRRRNLKMRTTTATTTTRLR